MDRTKARDLSAAAVKVLNEYFEPQGIKVTLGSSKFDSSSLTSSITFYEANTEGAIETKEEKDYKAYALSFGLDSVPFGTSFKANGSTFTICGLKPRSGKYPVLAKCNRTGKTFKFASSTILDSLVLNNHLFNR